VSIRIRLIVLGTLLAVLPVLLSSAILSFNAVRGASSALYEEQEKRLLALRDTTASSIESYFRQIDDQVVTYSGNLMLVEAMREFSDAFSAYASALGEGEIAARRQALAPYYNDQFGERFRALNNGESADIEALLTLSPAAAALQQVFIGANDAPLGEKDAMLASPEGSVYDAVHARYHPVIRDYQRRFGYYDIFLVEPERGHVVYSVFKELDYATSLDSGPYAGTGLAEAYRLARAASSADASFLTDFRPYLPSYDAPASFISSPIFDGDTMVGVLVFQMPVEKINQIMTHGGEWERSGLGASGETYLVGADFSMRSDGRLLLENPEAYAATLREVGTNGDVIERMLAKGTTIGLQSVDSEGTREALAGSSGFGEFEDYRGVSVLSAYRPVELKGLNWAVMSEIDADEALAPVAELRSAVIRSTLVLCLLALVAGALLGRAFSGVLFQPIKEVINTVNGIARGDGDLRQRLPEEGAPEIVELTHGVNAFIESIDAAFSRLLKSVVRLVPMSQELREVNTTLSVLTEDQKNQAEAVNLCIQDTRNSTQAVDEELAQIGKATVVGQQVVARSSDSVSVVQRSMTALSGDIDSTVQAIDQLKSGTDRIETVIDVISDIAEQTKLLALNATIEAARAGEAGKGFAIVADEVRGLAAQTNDSTSEIADMVRGIQASMESVVRLMKSGKESADESTQQVDKATRHLSEVSDAMATISERVSRINAAISAQREGFDQVNDRYEQITHGFAQSHEQYRVAGLIGADIDKLGDKLLEMIKSYEVTDDRRSTARRAMRRPDDAGAMGA
jgi:methyl-accepting chemotaxis protein